MALCLPRKRRATSLATRPRTLSVASITNHSCTTSAGFALKVDMRFLFKQRVWRALFHGRRSSGGNLLGGVHSAHGPIARIRTILRRLRRGATKGAAKPEIIRRIKHLAWANRLSRDRPTGYHAAMFSYRHAFHAGNHADVLKHTTLIATLQYLTQKDAGLTLIDTHAGAGLYRLDCSRFTQPIPKL
jgi:hypothetical protein